MHGNEKKAEGATAPLDQAGFGPALTDPAAREAVAAKLREIDLADSHSVMMFGARAQQDVTGVSDEILEGVKNKDVGHAGATLSEMLATLRGFNPKQLTEESGPGLLGRLLGAAKPATKILQRYETVRGQIDAIGDRLDAHSGELLRDIALLDRLYERTLDYFHQLALYIHAGDEMLRRLDHETIPARAAKADASGEIVDAQALRDLRATRDDLERRVHDLKLTRQVTMQSLPTIRLVQENDKGLVNKITSVLANTVPLWRQQLAQAVTIQRSRDAGRTLKDASDLTNELLLANAETLKQANLEARREIERGVFDVDAVKRANDLLISTIEDSLKLADEAKQRRAVAEAELQACELRLRDTLSAARSSAPAAQRPTERR